MPWEKRAKTAKRDDMKNKNPANRCGTRLCWCIFFANTLHVGASFISFAPTFFKKSERTHSAAPPFQAANAPLVCGLMRWGFGLVHLFRQHSSRRSKLYIVCSDFFQKVRAHSFRCSSFSSRKRSAGLRLDEMGALDWCIFFVNIVQSRQNLRVTIVIRRFCLLLVKSDKNPV